MRFDSSSPGASGTQCGPRRWSLTTRDGVRQGAPGGPAAGAGYRGSAERLRTALLSRAAEGGQLDSILVTKCSEGSS
jgi:hypothetical protein